VRIAKERLELLRAIVKKSDYMIVSSLEPDIERNFADLHDHIASLADYILKTAELCESLCEREDPRRNMLSTFRDAVSSALNERARRGQGLLAEYERMNTTKKHLDYISEVSVRISPVVAIAKRLEETREMLDELVDSLLGELEGLGQDGGRS